MAARIPGVTPAAVTILNLHMELGRARRRDRCGESEEADGCP
jgi:hypothetical protein